MEIIESAQKALNDEIEGLSLLKEFFNSNFEEAVKWSKKAVELGEKENHEQIEQLESELKSYKEIVF